MKITRYLNPFDKMNDQPKANFKKLTIGQKSFVVISTATAALIGSPLLIIGGIFAGNVAFRKSVGIVNSHRKGKLIGRYLLPLSQVKNFIDGIKVKSNSDLPKILDAYLKQLKKGSNLYPSFDIPNAQELKENIIREMSTVEPEKRTETLKGVLYSHFKDLVEKEHSDMSEKNPELMKAAEKIANIINKKPLT